MRHQMVPGTLTTPETRPQFDDTRAEFAVQNFNRCQPGCQPGKDWVTVDPYNFAIVRYLHAALTCHSINLSQARNAMTAILWILKTRVNLPYGNLQKRHKVVMLLHQNYGKLIWVNFWRINMMRPMLCSRSDLRQPLDELVTANGLDRTSPPVLADAVRKVHHELIHP